VSYFNVDDDTWCDDNDGNNDDDVKTKAEQELAEAAQFAEEHPEEAKHMAE
jgi:hypothetical protein